MGTKNRSNRLTAAEPGAAKGLPKFPPEQDQAPEEEEEEEAFIGDCYRFGFTATAFKTTI